MISIILKGGLIMAPIMLCSVISLAIIIERLLFWRRQGKNGFNPWPLIETARKSGAGEMVKELSNHDHPVARVLKAGAAQGYGAPSATVAMEAQAMEELARTKRFLPALDTIITLAPLLGLLGTIVGMIQSFGILSIAGMGNPHAVTGGVAEALIATAAGLIVAILTLIPYNYFQSRTERLTEEIEMNSTRLEVVLHQNIDAPRPASLSHL